MGSGVEDALIGCPRAECGKNADCSSVVSCGSDACSAKNVPSHGPLEFPGTEEVNKIRDRGSARIMQNKCILQFSK